MYDHKVVPHACMYVYTLHMHAPHMHHARLGLRVGCSYAYPCVYCWLIVVTHVGVCATAKKQSSGCLEWHNHSKHSQQNQVLFIQVFLAFLHWAQLPHLLLAGTESWTLTEKCRRGRGRVEDDVRPRLRWLQYPLSTATPASSWIHSRCGTSSRWMC